LAENLANYVTDFAYQTGIEVAFVARPEDIITPAEVSLQILRIAQEALTNVRKHARADHVDVHLTLSGGVLELRVADNGIGFPEASQRGEEKPRSFGLTSMRERAESIGGRLSVMTGPERGAAVIVTVPLAHAGDLSLDAEGAPAPHRSVP
jgi:signal transduction histidine kinase